MYKAGIVGLGNLGKNYIRVISDSLRAKVFGVFDIDSKKVDWISSEHNVNGFDSLDEMLGTEELDFVYISTPDFAHRDPVIKAAEAGADILVEKPLATDLNEAKEMQAAIENNGVRAQVCFANRYNQPFVVAKREVEQGTIGNILSIKAWLNDSIEVPTSMLSWAGKSSPGWFLMSHTYDLARWLIDSPPTEVYATGVKKHLIERGIDTFDSLNASISFGEDCHVFLESCWVLPEGEPQVFDFKFEVIGSEGKITIDSQDQMLQLTTDQHEYKNTLDTEVSGVLLGQTTNNFRAFMNALEEEKEVSPSVQEGVANVKALQKIHKSAENNRVEKLSE